EVLARVVRVDLRGHLVETGADLLLGQQNVIDVVADVGQVHERAPQGAGRCPSSVPHLRRTVTRPGSGTGPCPRHATTRASSARTWVRARAPSLAPTATAHARSARRLTAAGAAASVAQSRLAAAGTPDVPVTARSEPSATKVTTAASASSRAAYDASAS